MEKDLIEQENVVSAAISNEKMSPFLVYSIFCTKREILGLVDNQKIENESFFWSAAYFVPKEKQKGLVNKHKLENEPFFYGLQHILYQKRNTRVWWTIRNWKMSFYFGYNIFCTKREILRLVDNQKLENEFIFLVTAYFVQKVK